MADDTTTSPANSSPVEVELTPTEPALAEAAAPPEPSVATTLTVEPLEPTSPPHETGEGEGGEWDLLLQKLYDQLVTERSYQGRGTLDLKNFHVLGNITLVF